MALTNTRIKAAKSRSGNYKMADGGGMYLLVKKDGHKYWRLDCRFRGKRKTLARQVDEFEVVVRQWWEHCRSV
ncbi:MAG: Arm DNA-binding domain-containing protein [Gammaproteobacteria bacterium]|nr:Arm DNA-binding domain-containing protein [Gammaproteobacteria bacterium]